MSDILYDAAKFYKDNLEGRTFLIKAGRKKQSVDIEIKFYPGAFFHIVGLHKLKDIPVITVTENKERLYRRILNGELTYDEIKKSKYFGAIKARLSNYKEMQGLLKPDSVVFKSIKGYFDRIDADYLLSKSSSIPQQKYAHLFLKTNKQGISVPCSFFLRNDEQYIKQGTRWSVLSVVEQTKQASNNVSTAPAASTAAPTAQNASDGVHNASAQETAQDKPTAAPTRQASPQLLQMIANMPPEPKANVGAAQKIKQKDNVME